MNGKKNRYANKGLRDMMEQAFIAGSLRGTDAAGLFQVDDKLYMYKRAMHGAAFAVNPKVEPYIRDSDTCKVFVGHNRAATAGDVVDKNAHPFVGYTENARTVVGVHNGTLQGWDRDKFKVDSDWAIDKIASEKEKAFKDISGAYCFVWYDQDDETTLNILRNSERPMFLAFIKNQDRMVFASEYQMLYWLAARNNIELEEHVIDVAPGVLYQVPLDNPREFTTKKVDIAAKVVRSASYYEYTAVDWKAKEIERQKDYIKTFIGCLGKEESAAARAAEAVASDDKEGKGRPKPRVRLKNDYVSAEEVRCAELTEDLGTYVMFSPDMYDEDTKECWGTIVYPSGDQTAGVIRRVGKKLADSWKGSDGLGCKVVGAFINGKGTTSDTVLVLSRNAKEVSPEELSILEQSISRELAQFAIKNSIH